MVKTKTFATRNDLALDAREKAIALLNQHLADGLDLYSQTKQAHWNVKGMQFHQLHELFDTLAEAIGEYIDLIAERATALGGTALGVRMSAEASRLPEYPRDAVDGRQHAEALTARFTSLAKTSRTAIDAAASSGTPTPPTCSLKSPGAWTSTCGSWRRS